MTIPNGDLVVKSPQALGATSEPTIVLVGTKLRLDLPPDAVVPERLVAAMTNNPFAEPPRILPHLLMNGQLSWSDPACGQGTADVSR